VLVHKVSFELLCKSIVLSILISVLFDSLAKRKQTN